MAAFAEWQPRYAEHKVAVFPVTANKIPAVRGYLKVGLRASEQLAIKFPDNDAFGLACKRNRITVLDVDSPDERLLADGLAEHGPTPFIVRSGSGNFQAWYRHNGERRRVRPDPSRPIDILGDGFVVAPPSRGVKGRYELIQGSLDDLSRLPTMKCNGAGVGPSPQSAKPERTALQEIPMREGDGRNNALFRRALRAAHHAETREELILMATSFNQQFAAPLPTNEVLKTAASAWKYKEQGRLFVSGGEATAVIFHSDAEHLWDQPLALTLLIRLRLIHGHRNGGEFTLSQEASGLLGVSIPTFLAARKVLVERSFLEITHAGGRGKNDPMRVRLI